MPCKSLLKANQSTNTFGVYILDFQIQNIEVPPKVTKQQEENWKAERQGHLLLAMGMQRLPTFVPVKKHVPKHKGI